MEWSMMGLGLSRRCGESWDGGMDKEQPNVMFNQGGTLHPAMSTLLEIIRRVN